MNTDPDADVPHILAREFSSHIHGQHLDPQTLEVVKETIQLVHLSDGRTLGVEEYGIFDTQDVDLDNLGGGLHGYVSWPELLELLDRFRAEVRN